MSKKRESSRVAEPSPRDVGITGSSIPHASKIAVVGQGYVGLTLACAAADAGFEVVGIDIDAGRVELLARGELVTPGVDENLFRAALRTGRLTFSSSATSIATVASVFICVPTPLHDGIPDLSFVERASRDVAANVSPGTLIVVESTVSPGTTEGVVRAILEEDSGLSVGTDLLLASAPERIDPGSDQFGMSNTPRIVGGTSPEATEAAVAFYTQLADKVVPVSSARAAETSKLLENTFRHINIALVNELAMLTHELGIDVWEVIDAAATKPFGYMPFYPGPGVGGHCIPLDPTYLTWQIRRDTGRRFGVVEQAKDVNERMPNYVASRVAEMLNDDGRAVRGARILILGVTYKPDVGDIRESPAVQTMELLYRRGADVRFHDFYVHEVPLNGGSATCVTDLMGELRDSDLVVFLTPHSQYDLEAIADRARRIFDTRNAFGVDRRANVVRL
ncbi:MAG TPA: nucleotide sugar dehydrogenase [Actinomycetota bacterium]|jgi:nucleotide sugar dehydrogenase